MHTRMYARTRARARTHTHPIHTLLGRRIAILLELLGVKCLVKVQFNGSGWFIPQFTYRPKLQWAYIYHINYHNRYSCIAESTHFLGIVLFPFPEVILVTGSEKLSHTACLED